MGLTEQRYKTLRAKLDELGYRQPLALESLLLVEHIFSDLIHTKEELNHYKNLFQQNQERYGEFRTGVEPLKQENEKLVHECKRLHQALSEEQDVNEKLFKDLKLRIRALESNNSDLEFVCSQHLEKINELSRHLAEKGQKILLLKGLGKPTSYNKLSVPKTHSKKSESAPRVGSRLERRSPIKSAGTVTDLTSQPLLQPSSVLSSVADVCSASKKKIDSLLKELVTLKQEKLGYLEEIAAVQSKVAARNQEIERLQHMLELAHNTPMPIAGKCLLNCCKERCCCGNSGKSTFMEAQLREELTECQELQHEAMCRAVKLAERNAQLEEQLINSRSGGTCKCVTDDQNTVRKLQEKLDRKTLEAEELESKVKELQKVNNEMVTEKGASDAATDEQKKLEERIGELNRIEQDLLSEIERLTEVNRRQHDRIQHLENRLTETEKKLAESDAENNGNKSSQRKPVESMPQELANNSHAMNGNNSNGKSSNRYDSNLHDPSKPNASNNHKNPAKKITKNGPAGGPSLKTQTVGNKANNGKDKTFVKDRNKLPANPNQSSVDDTEDELNNVLKSTNNRRVEKEMMSKQMQAPGSKAPDKTGGKQPRYQKSPVRQPNANQNASSVRSKPTDAKKTVEKDPVVETRPAKPAARPVQARGKSKDETDASSTSSESNKNNNDAVPASKSDRSAALKSKKATSSSAERIKLKEKEQEEGEKLKREKQLLDDERKRLEETIKNLTEKQTELINKLQEAYAGSTKLNEQGATSSGQSDKELLIKLERLQAERDTYQKELSKIRDQISNLVDLSGSAEPGARNQSPSCILQSLVTERDFYEKEFNRLQKQLSSVNSLGHDQSEVGELRAKLNEKEQEICCLKEKIRDLCAQQRVSPVQKQNGNILRLEMERDSARADCSRLEEDRNALKDKLRSITEVNKDEMMRLEQGSHALQTTITKLEVERREMMNCLAAAKSKIAMLEKKLDDYREQMKNQQTDLSQQISHLNHIKMLQEQTDRALSTSQDMLTQTEAELASALERIHELEQQRLCLERELCCLRTERISLKTNMSMIDEEKDKLLLKVDEKTEQVVKLERDSKAKESRIASLESVLADMQRKLDCALDAASQSEQSARQCCKELDRLKQEMTHLEHAKDNALKENTRLQDDLAAITNDHLSKARELELAKREVEDLKMQLQGYVTEVRHIEDILEQKEKERSDMLDHYKSLSQESNALESINHTLESEAKSSKSQLRVAEQEIRDLKNKIEDKDALVSGYEQQISELTAHIACLEMKLANESEQIQLLESELAALREHCSKLDNHKQDLVRQVSDQETVKKKVEKEYHRVQAKHDDLEEELNRERKNSATLENVLAATRQETLEKKLNNKELRQQVEILEEKVAELQRKLNHGNDALRQCQSDTADYHQQLADLRREVTNDRFERARADERAEAAEKGLSSAQEELKFAYDEIDCLSKCATKFKEKIAEEAEGGVSKKGCECKQVSQQLHSCEEKLAALATNEKCTEILKSLLYDTEEQMKDLESQLERERINSIKSIEKNCELEEKLMASFKDLEARNSSLQKELESLKSRLHALESDNSDLTTKLNISNTLNEEYEMQIDKLQKEVSSFRVKRACSVYEQKMIEGKLSSAQELTDKLVKQKDSFLEQIMEIDNRNYHDMEPISDESESRLQYKSTSKIEEICAGFESEEFCSQNSGPTGKDIEALSDGPCRCSNVNSEEEEGDEMSEGKTPLDKSCCQGIETEQSNYPTNEDMENLLKNEEEIIRGYENQIEELKQRLKRYESEKNVSISKNCHCCCSDMLSASLKAPASRPSTVSQIETVITNLHMQLKAKDELLRGYTDEIAELAIEDTALAVEERDNFATSGKSKCKQCNSTHPPQADNKPENDEQFVYNFPCETGELKSDRSPQIANRRKKMSSSQNDGRSVVKSCRCLQPDPDEET